MKKRNLKDSRPTLRAVTRERQAVQQQIEGGRHERFVMGYLMGMNAALSWMEYGEGFAPPSVMFKTMRAMLADARHREKRKRV